MNVLINTETLNTLANSIASKLGLSTPLTLAQMVSAIQSMNRSLQTKTRSYTPSRSAQSETLTPDSAYFGLGSVAINVGAIPSQYIVPSGNKAISANGTGIDVKNYATVSVAVPFVTYYTGSSAPASSLGSNGDIYLQE